VRIAQDERVSGGRNRPQAPAGLGVVQAAGDPFVDPGRFASALVAGDVRVKGMRHEFRACGLGVPVIGSRLKATVSSNLPFCIRLDTIFPCPIPSCKPRHSRHGIADCAT